MKKFILILLVSTTSIELFSIPVLYFTRKRDCGWIIGCGTVSKTTQTVTQTLPDGSIYSYTIGKINCTGTGFESCPTEWSSSISNGTTTDHTACNTLSDYAINQIENNNIHQGTHTLNYYDSELNQTYAYTVVWSINTNGEQVITIDKIIFP